MKNMAVVASALALVTPIEAMAGGAGKIAMTAGRIAISEDEAAFSALQRSIGYVAEMWVGPSFL